MRVESNCCWRWRLANGSRSRGCRTRAQISISEWPRACILKSAPSRVGKMIQRTRAFGIECWLGAWRREFAQSEEELMGPVENRRRERASAGNCQSPNWVRANVSGGNASSLIVRRQETPINSFRSLSRLTSYFSAEITLLLALFYVEKCWGRELLVAASLCHLN